MKALQALILSILFSTHAFAQLEVTNSNNEKKTSYFYHNFGRIFTGSASYVRYNVKNTGDSQLEFLKAQISGGHAYNAYHSCKEGLAPQKSCWFEIRYWPLFEGWDTGRFIISFKEDNKIVVDLSGQSYKP